MFFVLVRDWVGWGGKYNFSFNVVVVDRVVLIFVNYILFLNWFYVSYRSIFNGLILVLFVVISRLIF